jgi:glutamine amidotransferase
MGYIGIVDFASNNSKSVLSMIRSLGIEAKLVSSEEEVSRADRLVIPGVGHIASIVAEMDAMGLRNPIINFAASGNLIMGICLGQHLLGLGSEESINSKTLGILSFDVKRLPSNADRGLRVPHVGWNSIAFSNPHPLFKGITDGSDFYFSHSYAIIGHSRVSMAMTEHSAHFSSVAGEGNVFGVQFHPEKSQKNGLRLLSNFCDL